MVEREVAVRLTEAVAPVPPPPVSATVGTLMYPEPPAVRLRLETVAVESTAIAVAPLPPPPVIITVGVEV
jgi:hypothetical protein